MVTYAHINHMCSLTCALVELRSEPNIPVGNPLELIHLCRGREKTRQNKHALLRSRNGRNTESDKERELVSARLQEYCSFSC